MTTATDIVAEAAVHAPTSGEYIKHHLGHLRSAHQTDIIDFSVINYDTILWSVTMALLTCLILWAVSRRVTSGARTQMASVRRKNAS